MMQQLYPHFDLNLQSLVGELIHPSQEMAMVLDIFVTKCLGKLTEVIEGEIGKVLWVKGELTRLHGKLSIISLYIQDAERKRQRDPAINYWVKELKDIMYDAEDIIDICLIEGGKLLKAQPFAFLGGRSRISLAFLGGRSPISLAFVGERSPISLLSSYIQSSKLSRDIWNQIKRVNDRLDEIKQGYIIVTEGFQNNSVRTSSSLTFSTNVATDIVGTQIIDAAQNLISKMVHSEKRCSVFGISGMGGIGKTTLAQKIFNHEMVQEQFDNRVWLHVSKDYSPIELLKQVLRGVGGNDDGVQNIVEIEDKITYFHSRRLLLVLDDIWSTNVWKDLLRIPILNGFRRTAILFTTRHENVARYMRADFIHPVEKMDEDSGWELIRKIVFEDEEDVIISELEEVGMEVVRKCDGLPLAVKVMAGVLFHKDRTAREWKKVVETDLWSMKEIDDELSNALYLSYEDLPSHLKQCFLSCAFYRGISLRWEIIRLWVAEGFVIEQSDNLMENIAEDYYKELIARNLLQIDFRFLGGIAFVMHDVLRSFGGKLMKEEGIIVNDVQCTSTNSSTKIHRLSVSNQGDVLSLPNVIVEQKCLRVLHLVNCPQIERIQNQAFESLKRLRVLVLRDTSIDSLPNSLMKLFHLKCLDLNRTKIRKLPKSIECLANLQTLSLSECESLHELPKGITRLSNLRCLRIENTPLTHVPKGVGMLKNLSHLDGFLVGHCDSMSRMDGGCDLDELQSLCNLIHLIIDKLERATTRGNRNFVLANKTFLRRLILAWTMNNNENNEEQITEAESICNQLSPPATLKFLRIDNFPGRQFPEWMVSISVLDSLADLTTLWLHNFPSCTELPPLGQLPNLKLLHIEGGEAIRSIGPEFLGYRMTAFPKLEYLSFESMPNWEAWALREAQDIEEPNEDVRVSNLNLCPNLKACNIIRCPNLEYVEKIGMLQEFLVVFPYETIELPQWLSSLINATLHSLQTLEMECNSLLLDSCSRGKQNWHIIEQIPNVIIHSIDRETRLLLSKDSYKYETKDEFGSFITHP